jgi:uracil-DNA glycosylase family 4
VRFLRTNISKCSSCPLRDRKRVFGEGPEEGQIHQAFLGEAPGEQEDLKGRVFVGPAGGLLSRGLTEAQTERFRCWVFNLLSCRPTGNKLDSEEGQEALECCKPGFHAELDFLEKRGLRVLTPLGGKPLFFLGIETAIGKARGSVYELKGRKFIVVPAYHPAFLLRGLQKEIPTWVADLKKAHELSQKIYKKPEENFNLFPELADLEDFVNEAVKSKKQIGVDIETIGLRPDRAKIMVVGLASSESEAISVPFFSKGLVKYWKDSDLPEVRKLIQKLFSTCPLIFQNALFDVLHLRYNGFQLSASDDILLAHHAIHPELPHNLAYIVSIYGKTPYWKDTLLNREDLIMNMEDEELRRYNLRDAVVLHQVLPDLLKDLEITKTLHIYRDYAMPLVEVLADATSWGISLDRKALLAWGRALTRKKSSIEKNIFSFLSLPSGFNLSSGDHLRLLIFGIESLQFKRARENLKTYDDPSRRKPLRKDTKKYKELLETVEVAEGTPILWNNHGKMRVTDGGKASTDDQSLLALRLAAIKRRSLVKNFAKRDEHDLRELKLLEKTLFFLERYRSYSETSKLLSTYSDFPTWKDGKVHTSFLIHGTKTGRLASRDPNLQNIPSEARKLFRARPGFLFIEGDYSNLEPRILAYVSGDRASIKTFEAGKNIHDENTRALFPDIPRSSEDWKDARAAAKKYRLAMNYGGGLYSIYEKVCLEIPDLNLSFPEFRDADERYREAHPEETEWLQKTGDTAVSKRELRNIFGRIRIFLGTENEIRREGVNFPIQSAAADIIGPAMIRLHRELPKSSRLLLQVHDSLLVEVKKEDKKKVIDLMKKTMQQEVLIRKKKVLFPVEFKSGSNWGEMK